MASYCVRLDVWRGKEAVLDGDGHLAANLQARLLDEHVQGVRHGSREAVLDGDHALLGHVGAHGLGDCGDGGEGDALGLGSVLEGGLFGEGAGGAQVSQAMQHSTPLPS